MFYTPSPVIYAGADWYGIKCPGEQMETDRQTANFNACFSKLVYCTQFETGKYQKTPFLNTLKSKTPTTNKDAGTNLLLTKCSQQEGSWSRYSKRADGLETMHGNGGHKRGSESMCSIRAVVNMCTHQSLKMRTSGHFPSQYDIVKCVVT